MSPLSPMSDHPYCIPERKTCMPCRSVLSSPLTLSSSLTATTSPGNGKLCVMIPGPPVERHEFSPVYQKCDGRSPKCGPCSAAKRELDCVFPLRPENRDKRNALPKGKACRSCRSVSLILPISFPKHPSPNPPLFFTTPGARKRSVVAMTLPPRLISSRLHLEM